MMRCQRTPEIYQNLFSTAHCFFNRVTGLLFGMTMVMVSLALVMAVIVTGIYLRRTSGKRVSFLVRRIFLAAGDDGGERRSGDSFKLNQFRLQPPELQQQRHNSVTENHVGDASNNSNNKHHQQHQHHSTYPAAATTQQSSRHQQHHHQHQQQHHVAVHLLHTPTANMAAAADTADQLSLNSDQETSFCRPCRRRRRHKRRSSRRLQRRHVGSESSSSDELESDKKCIAAEWKRLANKVDTVNFYIFSLSSAAVLFWIFNSIPFGEAQI